MRRLLAACLTAGFLAPAAADAQAFLPYGFSPLPSFAWAQPEATPSWEGSYARISSGFLVSSSRHYGTFAGPTLGFEGGRMWRDGNLVYGIVGAFEAITPFGNYGSARFGSLSYTRDFSGEIQFKVGTLVTDNVLLYTKVGGIAAHETWRLGGASIGRSISRDDIAVRPDARVGVEWAVTDRITLGIEAGVTGPGLR